MKSVLIKCLGTFLLLLVIAGCDRDEGGEGETVVLYSSVDETYTREVIREFEKETGIHVKLVSDSEAAKSTGLVNRLLAEKDRPVADVFWSGDPVRAERLELAGVGKCWQGDGSARNGVAWRLRMIIVNKRKENRSLVRPESVLDLAKPEYASKSCLANPQFGTTSMHLALIYELWGEDIARKFLKDFTANGGTMVASNGEVTRVTVNRKKPWRSQDGNANKKPVVNTKNTPVFVWDDMNRTFRGFLHLQRICCILCWGHQK